MDRSVEHCPLVVPTQDCKLCMLEPARKKNWVQKQSDVSIVLSLRVKQKHHHVTLYALIISDGFSSETDLDEEIYKAMTSARTSSHNLQPDGLSFPLPGLSM
jgi:hypothetical protein